MMWWVARIGVDWVIFLLGAGVGYFLGHRLGVESVFNDLEQRASEAPDEEGEHGSDRDR